MLTYTERQLTSQAYKLEQRTGPRLLSEMKAAMSAEERERLIRAELHAIGFEWLAYGTLIYAPPEIIPHTFFASYANSPWTKLYFSERHYEVDPRHLYAPESGLPLVWTIQDMVSWISKWPLTIRAQQFIDDLHDSGIRCGIFCSLPSITHPKERTIISLMSSASEQHWMTDAVIGQALTLGLCMHEFLVNHTGIVNGEVEHWSALSSLQKDILQCLAKGLCDKEIARRLDLSSYTVDYHLRQLRKRFSVRNRVQLVNAAMTGAMFD